MTLPTASRPPSGAVRDTLHHLDATHRGSSGYEAVPEAALRALDERPEECVGAALPPVAAALTFPSDSFTPQFRQLAVAAAPGAGTEQVVAVTAPVTATDGAEQLTAWLPGTDPVIAAALEATGYVVDRRQHQLRVPLPRPVAVDLPDLVVLRPFRVDGDEDAWLRVNNRAFANHPDQGGWVREVLARRMAEPWFDPEGFLLAWRGDELLGFCWTKVHPGDPPTGEIFVIGVDPDAQGLGLGRALVLAGLADLAERRHCPVAMLFVAADNAPAVALYERLGFHPTRTDTAYVHRREP